MIKFITTLKPLLKKDAIKSVSKFTEYTDAHDSIRQEKATKNLLDLSILDDNSDLLSDL